MNKLLLAISISSLLMACDIDNKNNLNLIECPDQIAFNALLYAKEYADENTQYQWGGRDPLPRSILIDCSGLIVKCYQYAIENTTFNLPFQDATVFTLFNQWTIETENPRQGDLIFMGDDKSNPTHISIFVKDDGINIYFIDATLKLENDINGVSERYYPKDDYKFLSFGKLLITSK